MHFSQVCLVTLECLLHFVNPAITPIHSLQQGLILSPGTAPPHHFAPQTQWTLLQHPTAQGVDTIPLLPPLILKMWTLSYYYPLSYPPFYYSPSAVFSHQSTLSAFLSPIHSYTFSCVALNEARHSRVKQIIMSINKKSTFWRLLTIFLRPHLKIDSLSCMQQAQILEIPPRLLDYWPWHWTLRGPVLSHNLCGHQLSQFWPILRIKNDWPLFAHRTQHLPFETVCVLSLLSNSLQLKLTKIEKLPVGQKFHIWLVFITIS